MKINQEIRSQLDRAKELLSELESSCKKDLESLTVSDKTRNFTQEILVKMRSLFDQAIHSFFCERVAPGLSEKEKERARVYFPIADSIDSMKSTLGRGTMACLERTFPAVFNFLEQLQPYNSGYDWMKSFSRFAGEKHIRLTPQKRIVVQERTTVTRRDVGQVSWDTKGVRFENGVNILGAPINPATQDIVPTPGVESKREAWISFTLGESGVDSLGLCKTVVNQGEKIIEELFTLF